jgi:hypothetical protein
LPTPELPPVMTTVFPSIGATPFDAGRLMVTPYRERSCEVPASWRNPLVDSYYSGYLIFLLIVTLLTAPETAESS